jgi:hypothetical protein
MGIRSDGESAVKPRAAIRSDHERAGLAFHKIAERGAYLAFAAGGHPVDLLAGKGTAGQIGCQGRQSIVVKVRPAAFYALQQTAPRSPRRDGEQLRRNFRPSALAVVLRSVMRKPCPESKKGRVPGTPRWCGALAGITCSGLISIALGREARLVPWLLPRKQRRRDQCIRSQFWPWMMTRSS